MASNGPQRIKTISEYHQVRGLPKPEHPLISVINLDDIGDLPDDAPSTWVLDFYSIAVKRAANIKYKYGQQAYDFDEGVMFFLAPGQVFGITVGKDAVKPTGLLLFVHPDFFWGSPLAKTIKQYEYFDYAVHEALFLSQKEETIINNILKTIQQEYHSNIDAFSQQIILSQIETLLNYSERFYHRQFITRKIGNHKILHRLETILSDYFNSDVVTTKGLPTVQFVAEALNVSPNYLSAMLKVLTGQSTQQHIHDKLIQKAKEKLSTTTLSVSEIAYELGFEHSQSFSKLFKSKTAVSPLAFRQAFN